jgi:hypothetical protein
VMERGALVDKMFYSIQLAFRGVPASLAVASMGVGQPRQATSLRRNRFRDRPGRQDCRRLSLL